MAEKLKQIALPVPSEAQLIRELKRALAANEIEVLAVFRKLPIDTKKLKIAAKETLKGLLFLPLLAAFVFVMSFL